jgi:hypothetical protein
LTGVEPGTIVFGRLIELLPVRDGSPGCQAVRDFVVSPPAWPFGGVAPRRRIHQAARLPESAEELRRDGRDVPSLEAGHASLCRAQ